MNTRKLGLGEKNIVGARVTQMRLKLGMKQIDLLARLQTEGVDISIPALSLLEGQKRARRPGGRLAGAGQGSSYSGTVR